MQINYCIIVLYRRRVRKSTEPVSSAPHDSLHPSSGGTREEVTMIIILQNPLPNPSPSTCKNAASTLGTYLFVISLPSVWLRPHATCTALCSSRPSTNLGSISFLEELSYPSLGPPLPQVYNSPVAIQTDRHRQKL